MRLFMTSLAPEDFRLLQASGLMTMALAVGVRLVPALHPYARRVGIAAFSFYFCTGLGIFLWRQF
jgi:hypothetical protein